MHTRKDIINLILVGVAVVGAFFYLDIDNSLFVKVSDSFAPVNFDEVLPRNIVKNAIPITLLEQDGNLCKVKGEKLFQILSHTYFVRSQELADKLQYNYEEHTLVFPCDQIHAEKSRLEVWYVVQESDEHATKYDYWVIPWEETVLP